MTDRQLERLLERHREQLHALPGVSGTGLGFRTSGSREVVVQVFVRPGTDTQALASTVRSLLGTAAVEIVSMPTPEGLASDAGRSRQ